MSYRSLLFWPLILLLTACGDDGLDSSVDSGGIDGSKDPFAEMPDDSGDVVRISMAEEGVTLLRLEDGKVWAADEPPADTEWDLAFEGWDIRTNGGASGPGKGSAMGPFEPEVYLEDMWPNTPFAFIDRVGGTFADWYFYDSAGGNVLYSRYHVYGVRRGHDLWKVQLLGYYGDIAGAPVSAMYSLRYAQLTPQGAGETVTISHIDATASGVGGIEDARSDCLDLASGALLSLTPSEAMASPDWHLCFRRDGVTVNGELGGPGDVGAVDLDQDATDSETLAVVKARSAESELSRFEAVDYASMNGLTFRGDRIVSGFDGDWVDHTVSPPIPTPSAWAILGATGESRWLLTFVGFEGANADGPSIVRARIKRVR